MRLAYVTVEKSLPNGSAGNRPVKYSQSTALFKANSAAAPANMKSIVSDLPQIRLTMDCLWTKNSISNCNVARRKDITQKKPIINFLLPLPIGCSYGAKNSFNNVKEDAFQADAILYILFRISFNA